MRNSQWFNIFFLFVLIISFVLFFHLKKEHNIRLRNGFYKIEAKVIKPKKILIIKPKSLKGKILDINISLPTKAYIRGFVKVKDNTVKTSYDFLEIAKDDTHVKSLKDILKHRFEKTTKNDWSKDIGLALLFGEGTKALPEDLLTVFSINSLVFLLIMSGIHIDIIFKNLSKFIFGEYNEFFAFLILLLYVIIFMEHGAPIVRAVSYLGIGVLLKYFYRYISSFRLFFISLGITLLVNISFYKNIGFWLSAIITFYIILYLKDLKNSDGFLGKIFLSMELSLVSIVSSMPIISKLGPISILAVFVVPFLLVIVEIYLIFGLLNIITLFSLYIFYKPLNLIAYYLGDIVYKLNLYPMYFKIPIIAGVTFDICIFLFLLLLKDRVLKIFSLLMMFFISYMLWGL